jgi:WD40 repeat protein
MKCILHILLTLFLHCLFTESLCQKTPGLIIPKGHTGFVSGTFTPNGKQLLTYGEDLNPTFWDVSSARILGYLKYAQYIQDAFFLKDKKTLVTVSRNGNVDYWDWQSKKILYSLPTENLSGSRAIINENKTRMSIITTAGSISNWDVIGRKKLSFIPAPKKVKANISRLALSNDGSVLATSFYRGFSIQFWRLTDGKLIRTIPIESELADAIIFFPDGSLCISADFSSEGKTTRFFNSTTSASFKSIEFFGDNKIIKYNNTTLISGADFLTLHSPTTDLTVTDYQTGKAKFTLDDSKTVIDFALLQNERLITIIEDGSIDFWNIKTGELLNTIEKESFGMRKKIVLSPDKKMAALFTTDIFGSFSLYIVDTRMQSLIAAFEKSSNLITDIFPSPDGNHIIFNEERSLKLWEPGFSKLKQIGNTESLLGYSKSKIMNDYHKNVTFQPSTPQIGHVFTNWKEGWIMTAREENIDTIKLWQLEDLTLKDKFTFEKDILSFRPDPQGKRLLVSFEDSSFAVMPVRKENQLLEYNTIKKPITGAKFFPDDSYIFFVAEDSLLKYDVEQKQILGANFVSQEEDEYYILSNSCKWLLRDNGVIIDIQTGKVIFTIPDMSGDNWKLFNNNDSLVAYQTTKGRINIFDVTLGKTSRVFAQQKGNVLQLAFCKNSKWLITSLDDRTVRIWDIITGKEIAAFVLFGETGFVLQLPSGFYMSSQDAAKLLHYVKKEQVISFDQLDIKYNRPDKVLEAIGNTDTALIKSYQKAWEKRIKKLGIDTTTFRDGYSVPEADFANRDAIEHEQKKETLTLHIKGADSTYKLDRFNVWVNETPLFGQRGISVRKRNKNNFDTTITIKLSQGENRIETSISNVNGTESYRMPLIVNYTPEKPEKELAYFIGIGIDKFSDSKFNLQYSSKDIRDLSIKLKEKYGSSIIIDTLFNENVTLSNVKSLKQKLQQTTVNDKVIIAYSGHGLLSKDFDYYLSTYSINFDKPEENGLSYDELENLLDSIPARKKLMLIDACHSGEVDKEDLVALNATSDSLIKGIKPVAYKKDGQLGLKNSFELMQSLFVNVGKSTGATIISAAAGTQFALERSDLKNGVFTYSILEAMKDHPQIKLSELKNIVGKRVEELTKGLQKPTSRNETIAVDWNVW